MALKVGDTVNLTRSNIERRVTRVVKEDSNTYRYHLSDQDDEWFYESEFTVIKKGDNMNKYYRVKQTNFMWEEGAILQSNDSGSDGGYQAISSLWDKVPLHGEYISRRIVEHADNADAFEEVWPLGNLERKLFGTKKQAQAAAAALYKGDDK